MAAIAGLLARDRRSDFRKRGRAARSRHRRWPERLQLCGTCHGETGNSKMENTPSLAGQPELFLTNQLILMRERLRKSEVMAPFVKGLKDDEIIALAAHYAKLPPEPQRRAARGRGAGHARRRSSPQALHCGSCHLPDYAGREQMPRLAHAAHRLPDRRA